MSVAQWVLFGVATWLVVAVVLGLLIARFLRSVEKQDETPHRPHPLRRRPDEEHDGPGSDDVASDTGDGDEIARARERRRKTG